MLRGSYIARPQLAQIPGTGKHSPTLALDANSGLCSGGWERFLVAIFAGHLHTQDQLSMETLSVLWRNHPCSSRDLFLPQMEPAAHCREFPSKGFKVGFLVSKPGSPACSLSNLDQVLTCLGFSVLIIGYLRYFTDLYHVHHSG